MALTSTEESQTRALIAQNAALLSLAESEATIISKLGATKVSLADLTAATSLNDTDLLLVRQGTTEKSVAKSVLSQLENSSVTYAKIQNVSAGKVLGRDTSGSGLVQELPISVDSAGNVGIGTSSPQNKLVVSNSGAEGLEINPAASGSAAVIAFNRGTSAYIRLTLNGSEQVFQTSGTERARIDSSGQMHTTNGAGAVMAAYDCRAWVNFNGTGTVAIRGSGNVSSITDNGTGDYTVNFSTAMPDVNYAAVFGGQGSTGATYGYATGRGNQNTLQQTTTNFQVFGVNGANAATDLLMVSVTIHR